MLLKLYKKNFLRTATEMMTLWGALQRFLKFIKIVKYVYISEAAKQNKIHSIRTYIYSLVCIIN